MLYVRQAPPLSAFADHANRLTAVTGPNPTGSIAAEESAREPELAEDMWPEPVRTAHMHAVTAPAATP